MMNSPLDMMAFQKQIKDNSTDLQAMVSELSDWTEQVNNDEKKRKQGGAAASQAKTRKRGGKATTEMPLPPIRNRIDIKTSLEQSEKSKPTGNGKKSSAAAQDQLLAKVKRDNTPMPDYYKAWDKIGREIDEASDSDENDTGDASRAKNPKFREESKSTAEMFKPTNGAPPNTTIVVKGARQQQISHAEECKLQGNAFFVSLDYSKAIECYTRCLRNIDGASDAHLIQDAKEMKKLVLSNRSQAYLKLKAYAKAYDDANRALLIDPKHVKSMGRRGTASYYLGKIKQAKVDFLNAIKLDPENLGFIDYIKKADERLQRLKSEAMEKIERRVMFTDLDEVGFDEHSVRIPVTELHLDQREVAALQKKKEEVVTRQQKQQEHNITEEPKAAEPAQQTKKKNKKKQKRKNKGLAAFMDGDELEEFNKGGANQ